MARHHQLKKLVDGGSYQPQPALVAEAMLRRRGVRALLTGVSLGPVGRIPATSTAARRAA
jgi:hypothetical protein